MRRLAHISDLHFGRTDERVVRATLEQLIAARPDLVVVTGDVTQRAKRGQFVEARAFFDGLPFARVIVPGNHDLAPLYRPWLRARDPYRHYRRYLAPALDSVFADGEIFVLGLNTAHPLRVTEGLVTSAQISWLLAQAAAAAGRFVVLAAHHPLVETEVRPLRQRVRGGARVLSALEQAGVQLVLSGHLHESFSGPAAGAVGALDSMLIVQSSTTTSTRLRGHQNAFNLIEVTAGRVAVGVNAWNGDAFELARTATYIRHGRAWIRAPNGESSLP